LIPLIPIIRDDDGPVIDLFRHFLLVIEHGTFTAAARHARVTQPALTASIQRLETALGGRLFVRGPGGASLTEPGRALVPHARAAVAAVEDGRRAVAEILGLALGAVRLGAGATVCTYYLPAILARFREAHPGVQLLLREGPTDGLLDALEAGDLDLAILARVPGAGGADFLRATRSGLVRERWLEDELVLVGAPGVDPRSAPFVTFGRGMTTRALLDARFPGVPIAMELGSIAAVKANTRSGVGVALVSRVSIQREVAAGQLVVLPSERTPILRPLYLVHRGKDRLAPAAAALAKMLRSARGRAR